MIDSLITSFTDGRVRLRHPALKQADNARQVRGLLASLPGMGAVTVNSRTGSLLLEYDPVQISREDLLELAGQWESFMAEDESVKPREQRACGKGPARRNCLVSRATALRFANRGMLAALGASLAFGFAGRSRGHIVAGGLFVLFNLAHLYAYRKKL